MVLLSIKENHSDVPDLRLRGSGLLSLNRRCRYIPFRGYFVFICYRGNYEDHITRDTRTRNEGDPQKKQIDSARND